jgi:uncharacterized protein (DUF433 family)
MTMPGIQKIISAFTEEQAERLTGVSRRQLGYWDRTGFFSPSMADENRRRPFSRLYSFRDLVSLQILNALRNESKVPLPHLREVKEKLARLGDDLWSRTVLYVLGRRVVIQSPDSDHKIDAVTGQGVLQIPIEVVRGNIERGIQLLRGRDESVIGKIDRKRGISRNQTVVAGTRIPVSAIKAFRAAGYTNDQIIKEYPSLTAKDIKAALAYGKAA